MTKKAFECFELGRIAYENEDFYHTVRWMSEALVQYELENYSSEVKLVDILDYFAFATARQGNLKHALELTQKIIEIQPKHTRAQSNIDFYKRTLKEETKKLRGDLSSEISSATTVRNPNTFQNLRAPNALGKERDTYEFLCREDIQVFIHFGSRQIKCFFYLMY